MHPSADRYLTWRWQWRRRVAIARGLYPPHTVIRGGHVVNVFTEELVEADVAIDAGVIAGIGHFPEASEVIDATGKIVAPSFVDAHIHIESSLLWMPEFARAVVARGTGAVITDPHEMANVAGIEGIRAMRDGATGLPLTIAFTAPSSVPASPLESPGATFDVAEIDEMLAWEESVGLGELMDLPGVLDAEFGVAARLGAAAHTRRDGHAPHVRGRDLAAYVAAGVQSDHESTTIDEAREKLDLGLMILLREGSSEKNLRNLLPLVTDRNAHRFAFASDDRDCHDLLTAGHIDETLRITVAAGLDPLRAVRLATWNAADFYRLDGLGAVAPGYRANLVILDDLESFRVRTTMYRGQIVAVDGTATYGQPEPTALPERVLHSVNLAPVFRSNFRLPAEDATSAVGVIDGQIVTQALAVEPTIVDGAAIANPAKDLLKLVCAERHQATGRVGVGLIRGFGLQRGAIASSIAHDAHNIVAVGADDTDLLIAIGCIAESQGGLAVVADGAVLAHLALPIAGLMSDRPAAEVAEAYAALEAAARELGSPLTSPFGTLAFMALSVIPEVRVTDRGMIRIGPEIA